MFEGLKPSDLRAMQHDLSARIEHELAAGLALRDRIPSRIWQLCRSGANT